MMQLSERVMLSRNVTTLVFLTIIAFFLIAILTVLESVRHRVLQRIAIGVDDRISQRVFDVLNRQHLKMTSASRGLVLSDLNTVRDFISGNIVVQLLDLFWVPLLVLVLFLLHVFLGLTMVAILAVTVAISIINQRVVAKDSMRSQAAFAQAQEFARAVNRSADTSRVMGMLPTLRRRWHRYHSAALGWQAAAVGRSEYLGGSLRFIRHSQYIIMLVVGAALYLMQQISAGAAFAVVFIGARAIGPVIAVTSSWRMITTFLSALDRLDTVLNSEPGEDSRMSLPKPTGSLAISRVYLTPPNAENVVLSDISFAIGNGRVLGVVGPSGAGKSSLAKLLIGAWRPRRGTVTLDGHDLAHWNQDELGEHVGYVPQEVELLPGTIAENIARFRDDGPLDYEAVLEAAQLAGIQDIVQALPEGYNTKVGGDGNTLSGGQRQRVALARAVYGKPSLLVLDEPNSNLDAVGEQSLGRTLTILRNRGAVVVIVTHRVSMLAFCDELLVMKAGTVHTFGPRDLIMSRLSAYRPTPAQVEAPIVGAIMQKG
jgi:PrtD family type I secretion system ABC transporter